MHWCIFVNYNLGMPTSTPAAPRKPGPTPKDPILIRVPLAARVRQDTREFLRLLPAENMGQSVDMLVELYRKTLSTKTRQRGA